MSDPRKYAIRIRKTTDDSNKKIRAMSEDIDTLIWFFKNYTDSKYSDLDKDDIADLYSTFCNDTYDVDWVNLKGDKSSNIVSRFIGYLDGLNKNTDMTCVKVDDSRKDDIKYLRAILCKAGYDDNDKDYMLSDNDIISTYQLFCNYAYGCWMHINSTDDPTAIRFLGWVDRYVYELLGE